MNSIVLAAAIFGLILAIVLALVRGGRYPVKSQIIITLAAAIFSLTLAIALANAHDMEDENFDFYQGLTVPQGTPLAGSSCCNGGHGKDADCQNVEVKQAPGPDGTIHWWAFIDSKTFPDNEGYQNYGHAPNDWVMVPAGVIITGKANPTGMPVACWYYRSIRCFVEGTGT